MTSVFTKNLSTLLRGPDPDAAWFRRRPWPGPFIPSPAKRLERLVALNDRLAGLAESNMPFADALAAFAEDERRTHPFQWSALQMRELLTVMRKDLQAGYSLSETMERRPRLFPRFYRDLVRAGEESGRLAQTMRELSDHLLRRLDLRLRAHSYLSYLLTVALFVPPVLLFVIVKLLPVFREILATLSSDTWESVSTIETGWFATTPYWLQIIVAGVFASVGGLLLLSVPSVRFMVQRRRLGWFAYSLQKLLEGAVPFDEALELAGGKGRWRPVRRLAQRLRTRVLQGQSFSDALRAEGSRVPKGMTSMAALGESTGHLPEAMGKIADLYLAQARRHARVLLDILSPLALLIMGGVVLAFSAYLVAIYAKIAEAMVL